MHTPMKRTRFDRRLFLVFKRWVHRSLWLLVLFFSIAPLLPAQSTPSPVAPSTITVDANAALVTDLESAMAAGDGPRLLRLCEAHQSPRDSDARAAIALDTVLARAWLLLGNSSRALLFARNAARHESSVAAQWLAAEIHYLRNEWAAGDTLRSRIEARNATSPALPYLRARRILAQFADADAIQVHPSMVTARQRLHQFAAACTSLDARRHADFDPRFLSLGIDAALFELDYELAAYHAIQLSALRPANTPLARLALALAFDAPARRDAFLDTLRNRPGFPADEHALWEQQARLLDLMPAPDRASAWLTFADTAARTPALAPVQVHLIAPAAALLAADDPRFASTAKAYADAALAARSSPHARAALVILPRDSADTTAVREQRIALASLAAHHDLAAVLTEKETPHHLDDFNWLARHRTIIARHQMPGVYINYLKVMERLRPADPVVLLQLARTLDHATHSTALEYYQRVFALVPEKLTLSLPDWFAYRNLASASDQNTRSAAATKTFEAAVQRIAAATPDDLAAACFHAHLLRSRAKNNPADRGAADAAYTRAINLAPEAFDIMQALGGNRSITTAI
jgi:hypothetical protein